MALKEPFAVLVALIRTLKWGIGFLRGGQHILKGRTTNLVRDNIIPLAILAIAVGMIGLDWLSISLSTAILSIFYLGPDASIATALIRIGRVFALPVDDLVVGGVFTTLSFSAFLLMAWNYFKSQYRDIMG